VTHDTMWPHTLLRIDRVACSLTDLHALRLRETR
jgi:hypothetical protein